MEDIKKILEEKRLLENEKKTRVETLQTKREEFVIDCFLGLDVKTLEKLGILAYSSLNRQFEEYLAEHEEKIDKSDGDYGFLWDNDRTVIWSLNCIYHYRFFEKNSKRDQIFYVNTFKYDIKDFDLEEWIFIKKNLLLIKKYLIKYAQTHIKDLKVDFEKKYIQYICPFCGFDLEVKTNYCSNCGSLLNQGEKQKKNY